MNLADEIQNFRKGWRPSSGPSCGVATLMEQMSDKDCSAFKELLDSHIYGTHIAEMVAVWASDESFPSLFRDAASRVVSSSIQRHRRSVCRCQWTQVE